MSNNDDSDMDGLIGFISGAILGICLTCLFVSVGTSKEERRQAIHEIYSVYIGDIAGLPSYDTCREEKSEIVTRFYDRVLLELKKD